MNRRLTFEELQVNLHYDPATGAFTRIANRVKKHVGESAGHTNKRGYVVIHVNSSLCRAHQLAWLYMTGSYPQGIVDHIDGNKSNNAFANLRIVDAAENTHNIHAAYSSNKTTGMLGANYCKANKKYLARIMVRGVMHNIGRFNNAQDAHNAYMRAKAELHPKSVAAQNFNCGENHEKN